MVRTWTASNEDPEALARMLEGHLNEHAAVVVSVGYSVSAGTHFVLAVYSEIETADDEHIEAAVSLAEEIVEEAQAG